jgi:hypothetical protein
MSEGPGQGEGWASPGWTPPGNRPSSRPGDRPDAAPGPPPASARPAPQPPYPHGQPYPQGQSYPQGQPHPQGGPDPHAQPYPPAPPGAQGYAPTYYAEGWQAPVGPPPPARRDGVRLALRIVGGVVAVGLVAGTVAGVRTWQQSRAVGTITKPSTVSAKQVATGHCLAELPADGDVSSVRLVPCDQPHVAEVVGSRQLDDKDWPGWSRVSDQLTSWCEMDTAQAALGLRPVVWGPTERGWSQGDRVGLCLAWSPDGALNGSFVAGDQVRNVDGEG